MTLRRSLLFVLIAFAILPAIELAAQPPSWTDTSGKYKVEADFVRIEGDSVRLKKSDGKEISVAMARLNAASQEQARRLEKVREFANEPPLPEVAVDGMPPELPPMTDLGEWEPTFKPAFDRVVANYKNDPVSAYFSFRDLHDRKTNGPTEKQKAWLSKAAGVCRAYALAVVTADYVRTSEAGDLRGALISSVVAKKIHAVGVGEKGLSLAAVKSRTMSNEKVAEPIWKVEAASASAIEGDFADGFGATRVTMSPKPGFRLVRVNAKVTNISGQSDLSYAPWSFDGLKAALLLALISGEEKAEKPTRLAMDEFIYFVTGGGDWINCGYVCTGAPKLRSFTFTVANSDVGLVAIGGNVPEQESFDVDVIFTVPNGIEDGKLLILGAKPVQVKVASE